MIDKEMELILLQKYLACSDPSVFYYKNVYCASFFDSTMTIMPCGPHIQMFLSKRFEIYTNIRYFIAPILLLATL